MKTSVFLNNKTQAVRIPKEIALPDDVKQVTITRNGDNLIISPVEKNWDSFFDGSEVSEDFMLNRNQPAPQQRDEF